MVAQAVWPYGLFTWDSRPRSRIARCRIPPKGPTCQASYASGRTFTYSLASADRTKDRKASCRRQPPHEHERVVMPAADILDVTPVQELHQLRRRG